MSDLVDLEGRPLTLAAPDRKRRTKATAEEASEALGVPLSAWVDTKNSHRVVTRAELLSLLRVTLGPLDQELARQHAVLVRHQRWLPGYWVQRALAWLRRPLVIRGTHPPSSPPRTDA